MIRFILLILLLGATLGCQESAPPEQIEPEAKPVLIETATPSPAVSSSPPAEVAQIELTPTQELLLQGARETLGDVYDDSYYAGGPPPEGRGACTDVVYAALLKNGINLQDEVEDDVSRAAHLFPNLGDRNINYRRCPNLIVWFERHTKALPLDSDYQPGDIIFWSLMNDGVADHTGIVSDKPGYVIHNFPPQSREDGALQTWTIVGHFRLES